jgi:four helix bundle protein
MANIAEGFERRSLGEFSQFLIIAKASCAELRSHLYVALDVGYLQREHFDELMSQAEEVARVLSGLRASIEKQRGAQRTKT